MFDLDDYEDAEALRFGCCSQVGIIEDNFPLGWGNYFYLMVDDVTPTFLGGKGREIEIVNMWYENLQHLVDKGEVSFPIKIKLLTERCAIVVDPRVNPKFLCEITYRAPMKFWSLTELTKRQIEIDSGALKVIDNGNGMVLETREIKTKSRVLRTKWTRDIGDLPLTDDEFYTDKMLVFKDAKNKEEKMTEDLEISSNGVSSKARKLKTKWTPCTEEEKQMVLDSHLLKEKMKYYYDPGYSDDQPVMGFFNWSGSDFERVKKEYPDSMTPEEKQIILDYMDNSLKKESSYMGLATSRIDESFLGSSDMRTPDGKWIFPEQWDKHYVDNHNICPPREFVEDAIKWKKKNK